MLALRPQVTPEGQGSASSSHKRGQAGMRAEEGSLYKVSDMINVDQEEQSMAKLTTLL